MAKGYTEDYKQYPQEVVIISSISLRLALNKEESNIRTEPYALIIFGISLLEIIKQPPGLLNLFYPLIKHFVPAIVLVLTTIMSKAIK